MGKGKQKRFSRRPRGQRFLESTAQERLDWARDRWREDPDIPLGGYKGMQAKLREVFGVVARDAQLVTIRDEVRKEIRGRRSKPQPMNPVLDPEKVAEIRPRLNVVNDPSPPPPHNTGVQRPEPTSKPGSSKSTADHEVRRRYARRLMQENPGMKVRDVVASLRREYGMAISPGAIGSIRRELQSKRKPAKPNPPRPKIEKKMPKKNTTPEEAIRAAIELLMEDVPGLVELRLAVVDGSPRVEYKVQAIQGGKVEL